MLKLIRVLFVLIMLFSTSVVWAEDKKKSVLFVCTGNYFRSRFAEAVFNYYFGDGKSEWKAFSRGLKLQNLTPAQRETHVSIYSIEKMEELQIPASFLDGQPTQIGQKDLDHSQIVIGLNQKEHAPMFQELFPNYDLRNIEFWDVPDSHKGMVPTKALDLVFCNTLKLGTQLTGIEVSDVASERCFNSSQAL